MIILKIIIAFLYAFTGIIAIMAYFPTIYDLIKKINSANLNSYVLWSFTTGISFLYALIVLSDLLMSVITGIGFSCCLTTLILLLRIKHK